MISHLQFDEATKPGPQKTSEMETFETIAVNYSYRTLHLLVCGGPGLTFMIFYAQAQT